MAERLAYLEAVVGADITQFRRGMADVRNDLGILSETMGGLGALGRTLTYSVTTPIVALGTYTVQAAAEFEEAMRNVNSIAHLSEAEFATLSDQVLEFGSTIRAGPTEAANALYTTFSAGITDTTVAMEFMEVASATAEAGLADLTVTTEALIGSFLAFNTDALPMEQQLVAIREQADALTQMVQIGVGTMDEFASAVGQVNPTAVSLGIGIEELYGSMAYLTQRGLSAARASVSLNAAFTALLKPSEAMEAAFQELGVSTGDELIQQFGSFEAALVALAGTTDGSATSMRALFREVRAARAVDLLVSDLAGWNTALEDFNAGLDGATERAREQQLASFAAHWDIMTSSITAAAITIGDVLMPALIPIIDAITSAAQAIMNMNPEVIQLGVGAAAVAAALGPLLWIISSIVNPIGAAAVAVAALGTAFAVDFGNIRQVVSETIAAVVGDMAELDKIAQEFLNELFPPEAVEAAMPEEKVIEPSTFITIEAGDSAWQIWSDHFRNEFATFQDFLDATELEGVVLHPDDIIEIPAANGMLGGSWGQQFLDNINGVLAMTPDELKKNMRQNRLELGLEDVFDLANMTRGGNMVDRVSDAFREIEARLGIQLGAMAEHARSWFDSNVGAGINWFASLFEGGGGTDGDTPVYRAIEALLEGDIGGAIDAIIPNLGTDLQNAIGSWGINIENAFPTISAALGRFFNSAAQWVLDEGIPTVARSMGLLAGNLVAGLYDAIETAVGFFTGGGASDTADAVGDYMQEGIADPFAQGFQDAIAGTDFQTAGLPAITAMLEGIAAALDTLEFDQWFEGLTDLATGVGDLAGSLAEADWTGLATLVGIIVGAGNIMSGELMTALGQGLTVAGEGIKDLADGISLLFEGDPEGLLKVAAGLGEIGMALLAFPVGIINGFLGLIEAITGWELPDIQAMMQSLSDQINGFINGNGLTVNPITVTPEGVVYNIAADPTLQGLNQLPTDMANQIRQYLIDNPPNADVSTITITTNNATPTLDRGTTDPTGGAMSVFGIDSLTLPANNVTYTITPNTTQTVETPFGEVALIPIGELAVQPATATVDMTNTAATIAEGSQGVVANAVLPEGELSEHFAAEIDTAASAAAVQLGNTFMQGGIVDPQVVVDNFLTPLETSWNTTFGPTGPLQTSMSGFVTAVGGGFVTIGDNAVALNATLTEQMPMMTTTIQTETATMTIAIDTLRAAVDLLAFAFASLGQAASDALNIASGTPDPNNGLDGERADGGPVLSGGTYLVGERGPEIVTMGGSGFVLPNEVLMGMSGGDSYMETNTNNVTIYEATNVDRMMYELRRRGVRL